MAGVQQRRRTYNHRPQHQYWLACNSHRAFCLAATKASFCLRDLRIAHCSMVLRTPPKTQPRQHWDIWTLVTNTATPPTAHPSSVFPVLAGIQEAHGLGLRRAGLRALLAPSPAPQGPAAACHCLGLLGGGHEAQAGDGLGLAGASWDQKKGGMGGGKNT